MASPRYTLNIKPEDLQPDVPRELTPKEKRQNFWFYHKWHIFGGLAAALILGSIIWEIATQVEPDYTIGLLTTRGLPTGIGEALSEQLTPYFDDRNGDGEVVVNVMEYTIATSETADTVDPNLQMANVTKLMGDLDMGESMLFLTDDLEYFEEQYMLFAYNDGSVPEEGVKPDYSRMGVRWGDCPLLAELPLGNAMDFTGAEGIAYQRFLQDFQLVQRIVFGTRLDGDEEALAYHAGCAEIFQKLTQQ